VKKKKMMIKNKKKKKKRKSVVEARSRTLNVMARTPGSVERTYGILFRDSRNDTNRFWTVRNSQFR